MNLRFSTFGLALVGALGALGTTAALAQQRPATAATAQPGSTQAAPRPAVQAAQPLQRSEFIVTMDGEFLKMDADKDGQLVRKEIEDYQRLAAMAAARQRNQQLFAALDIDRNGMVSSAEFLNLQMPVPPSNANIILGFDSNRDGKVSKVENRAGTLGNFDRMDSDKDGVVTDAEMRAGGIK